MTGRYLAEKDEIIAAKNREIVTFCRDIGIGKLFFDDDLRLGNHGNQIAGCFCDSCLCQFGKLRGAYYSRTQMTEACKARNPLSEAWMDYNCSKITKFMRKTAISDIQTDIMVMHGGSRYHGIDISSIQKAVPNCLFRVGELHFSDRSFEGDIEHADELASIKAHMALIDNKENCYSETTVFPPRALSPENLVKKAELAIRAGIRNIFLMSGTWIMSDAYWLALAENHERLERLAVATINIRKDTQA